MLCDCPRRKLDGHRSLGTSCRRGDLPITAREADLRGMDVKGEFDCVLAIGLLMFFP
jgi:hypothetical protein